MYSIVECRRVARSSHIKQSYVVFSRNVLSRSVAFRLVAVSSLDMTWHVAVYRFVASCLVALFCLLDELGGKTGPNKVM